METVPSTLPEEEDLPAARKVALERRSELKLATNRATQASLETKIEKTRYIPDVAIQASYTNPVNINFLPQNIGSVGVLLTWQPWDWGQKRHNVAQKVFAICEKPVRSSRLQRWLATLRRRNYAASKKPILSSRYCLVIC